MSTIIDNLNWRYATKVFDSTKKVSESDLQELLEATRLAPSSYGLQPWRAKVITNPQIRQKLKTAAWNQAQVGDAFAVIVFCAHKELTDEIIHAHVSETAHQRNQNVEQLKGYTEMLMNYKSSLTVEQQSYWMQKQAYIALGFLLFTAAQKQIDACPMEGFDKTQFDQIIGLEKENLQSVVMCTIGYRSEKDTAAQQKKVRFPVEEMMHFVK